MRARLPSVAIAVLLAACSQQSTAGPSATATITPSPTLTLYPTESPTPEASGSASTAPVIPPLAAIQMVGATHGWAVGSHAIYATSDGRKWVQTPEPDEDFAGVDFVSTTTGWAVGVDELLGTQDSGRSWTRLGEPPGLLRSVHFVSPSLGWGVAGGSAPEVWHGWLVPQTGSGLVVSHDGGRNWARVNFPADPQTDCFSDPLHGLVGAVGGQVFRTVDGGRNWTRVLQRPGQYPFPYATLVECAAPAAAWVDFEGGDAGMSHSPYIAYATPDGVHWRSVLEEPMMESAAAPGVPAGPDSYPGSFSVVDPADAVFVGDGPATGRAAVVIANNGGATLRSTGALEGAYETEGAAFVSTATGWIIGHTSQDKYVIATTNDGGHTWTVELSVP